MPRIRRLASGATTPGIVEGLARGLAVLGAFDAGRPALSVSEVAAAVGLSRASAARSLATLVALGFARQDGRAFRLTPKVLGLARAFLAADPVASVMQPVVERVAAALGEACSAAVLDGPDVVFVARATPTRILSVGLELGFRLPAEASAVGRVLLAELDDDALDARLAAYRPVRRTDRTLMEPDAIAAAIRAVRRDGHCVVDEEVERGFRSVALPVARRDGRIACAIHLGLHRGAEERPLAGLVAALREAAAEARPLLI